MLNSAAKQGGSNLRPSFAFKKVTEANGAAACDTALAYVRDDGKRPRLRTALFVFGDVLFLLLVSVVATTLMHLVHELGWNLAFTLICGMAVAMLIQMLLAFGAAPILGSIESMVPSMVVAMISPMAVCTLDVLGFQLHWRESAQVGVVIGLIMFGLRSAFGPKAPNYSRWISSRSRVCSMSEPRARATSQACSSRGLCCLPRVRNTS